MSNSFDEHSNTYQSTRASLIWHLAKLNEFVESGKVVLTNEDEIINKLDMLLNEEKLGHQNLDLLKICDNLIWTKDIIFNYELQILEKKMAGRNIIRFIPPFLSFNQSKIVKNSISQVAIASRQKNIDKDLLIDTVKAINGYLDSSESVEKLNALNSCIDKLPKESKAIFYLKSLVVTATCLAVLTVALTLGVHFGFLDINSLIAPLNILKDVGVAIFKFAQGSAFPLPKILGGDEVPIWSLTVGFLGGALVGLLGVQTVKTMVANKTNVADKSVTKNSIYNGQLRRQEMLESRSAFLDQKDTFDNIENNLKDDTETSVSNGPAPNGPAPNGPAPNGPAPNRLVPTPPSNAETMTKLTELQKELESQNNSNSNNISN